ncbi:MAG TPA: hypothetical protein PLX57_08625 [Ornithinibacter sp.]|nr:hypothetical protein [Ornithinibacter sp.]HQW73906.1 hypothetical protein [Ornithinibacter sp.]
MHKMFALGEVKAVEDADGDPNGEFDVILSAPTLDRDGEVIDAKVFDPLPAHITFDIDHGMSTATTVGSGVPSYDEAGRLRVKGTYSSIPRAQEVRTLVREGHIRTTSVAFMGAVREEKDGVTHIVKAELLNGAFVPIPSNRESVVLSAKAYDEKAGAAEIATPPAVVRKAHGMTANELRDALDAAVRSAHGAGETYTWVRDYADDWVVFEVASNDDYATWRQSYGVNDGAVTLSGLAEKVVALTTYKPAAKSATPAPVTPSAEDGKSPASTVVEMARIRGALSLLSVED